MLDPCPEKHYVGEIGTLFFIDCGIDITYMSRAEAFIKRPDGTSFRKDAIFMPFENNTDFVSFTIAEGDFNQAGKYIGQIFVVLGSWSGWGSPFHIEVENPVSSSSSSSSSSA